MGDWVNRLIVRAPYSAPAVTATVILLVITSLLNPGFLTRGGWVSAASAAIPFIVLAVAQAPAIISGRGGLDLSLGPAAGLIAVVVAAKVVPTGLDGPLIVLPVAIGMGAAVGLVNGLLVAVARIPPIIATLATYLVYAGAATQLLPSPGGTAPIWLTAVTGTLGPLPGVVIVFVILAALWLGLMATAFRRNLFAIGGNDRAAFASGVNVTATRLCAYVLTGVLAGLAGLLLVAVLGGADATTGPPYTLVSIAGAALGGVSLTGGRGGLLGPAFGGATLFLIQNLLSFIQVSAFTLQIVYGAVVLGAIVLNGSWDIARRRLRVAGGEPAAVPAEV